MSFERQVVGAESDAIMAECSRGGENVMCSWTRRVSLVDILVLAGNASAGRMTPPVSTRISARMKRVQQYSSPVNVSVPRGLLCALA